MKARLTLFNCATLTASVSALPAATPVIWRVFVPSPTETAPQVPLHVFAAVGAYVSVRTIVSVFGL